MCEVYDVPPGNGVEVPAESYKLRKDAIKRADELMGDVIDAVYTLTADYPRGSSVTMRSIFEHLYPGVPFSNRTGDPGPTKAAKEYHYLNSALRVAQDRGMVIRVRARTVDLGLEAKIGRPYVYYRLSNFYFTLKQQAEEKKLAEVRAQASRSVYHYPGRHALGKRADMTATETITMLRRQTLAVEIWETALRAMAARFVFPKPWYVRLFERITGYKVVR